MTEQSPVVLDHLIYVASSQQAALDAFKAAGFKSIVGGKHADGITANVLVTLADGVYLEAVYFLKDRKTVEHWWKDKAQGWADWSISPGSQGSEAFVARVNELSLHDEGYANAQRGGRRTTEGKELEWKVAFNRQPAAARGRLPFSCEDVTPREWRVPAAPDHQNGAKGVRSITLLAKVTQLSQYLAALRPILGTSELPDSVNVSPADYPPRERTFSLVSPSGAPIVVNVREAANDEESTWVREHGEGLFEVELVGEKGDAKALSALGIKIAP